MSQNSKIIKELRKAGNKGVTNKQLSDISLKYSSRIAELRQDGYNIYAERQRFFMSKRLSNTWRYYLIEEKDK
jgi:hypothetical protein